jgi:hypothetical protein
MRLRGLMVAAAVLAILAGGVWWSEKAKKNEASKPPADASPKITNLPESDIKQVEVKRKAGETTVLVHTGDNAWKITSPEAFPVDQTAVSSFLSSVASLASDSVVEEKAGDLTPFGLTSGALEVTVTKKDGKNVKIVVGDETPTGSGFYARLDGDPRVFTIASYSKTNLDKPAKELRDKRLLTFDADKLVRVELTAKKTTTEFGKNNQNEWAIVKPQPYRADGFAVEELLRRLREAKLDPNVSEEDAKKAGAAFAAAVPIATAKVTDAAGTQTLEVRKSKDNKYYTKSSAVAGIHTIPNDSGDGFDKSTDDFRNKKIFDFGFSEPGKIEYKDSARSLSLVKSGEKWTNSNKLVDTVGVQSFIDRVRDLAASKFADGGFGAPVTEITVISNEGKRTEKVAIAKDGDGYLARREGEPALYRLEAKTVDDLQKAAGDIKEPPPPNPAKK